MTRVQVELPPPVPARYEVQIEPGLLHRLKSELSALDPARRWVLISDSTVAALFGDRIAKELDVPHFTFEAGESNKTVETWASLTDALLSAGLGRDGGVVALGGGVTGDVAGFVAATYMRGIPVVQVPSTLLAMIDASIGGKTGLDTPAGKNLVGAFHQPQGVLIDPELLRVLPESELRAGLAEAIKHGAIADAAYLTSIHTSLPAIMARATEALHALVTRSVEIKVEYVNQDPLEAGPRAALNFGHTIGHALERVMEYRLHHGHAVAIGMVVEAELGEAIGVSAPGTAAALREVLEAAGLPVRIPEAVDRTRVVAATASDKKARGGAVRYSLIARPGVVARAADGAWTHSVDSGVVDACVSRN